MGMDPYLANAFKPLGPKVNEDILRGITVPQMEHFEESIDLMWRTVAKDFPKELVYIKGVRCTPLEEFNEEPRVRVGNKVDVDIAPNDIYLMKYLFAFKEGDKLIPFPPVYLFLPFVREGGTLFMSGSRWQIVPMLGDVVLSFEGKRIFCQFSRAKFHINNAPSYTIYIDGEPLYTNVPWSILYNISSKRESIKISLTHYVFAKYGLRGGFKRFFPDLDVEFFDGDPGLEKYPTEKFVRITGFKGMNKPTYGGTDVVTIIPRKQFERAPAWLKTFLASTYFTLDRFGKGGAAEWGAQMKADPKWSEDLTHWRLLMGLIIWERTKQPAIIIEDMNKHMSSLDRYIDDIVLPRAARIGFDGENLYDFLVMAVKNWEDWQLNWYKISAPVYNKEINVLYQINNGIMMAIFNFFFDLQNECAKGPITFEQIRKLFKNRIKPRMIFFIRSESPRYVTSFSSSSDNAFTRLTCTISPQKGNATGKTAAGAGNRAHASLAEVTSPINLTKADPTGLTRMNPYTQLENLMYVVRDPKCAAITDKVQAILDREMKQTKENEEIDVAELLRETGRDD